MGLSTDRVLSILIVCMLPLLNFRAHFGPNRSEVLLIRKPPFIRKPPPFWGQKFIRGGFLISRSEKKVKTEGKVKEKRRRRKKSRFGRPAGARKRQK